MDSRCGRLLGADFHRLPSNLQINLIESRWNIIGGPAMLPLLREIYADPFEPHGGKDIAVRRIYELAPEEGRRIILSQLTGRANLPLALHSRNAA